MDDLTSEEKKAIKKTSLKVLKSHYVEEYSIFELCTFIRVLQKLGMNNKQVANEIGIKEDSLYSITPIEHASETTKQLIKDGKIDGYKAGKLLRAIGKNPNQDEFMRVIVENDYSIQDGFELIKNGRSGGNVIQGNKRLNNLEFREIADVNIKLKTILNTFKEIQEINNKVGEKIFKDIKLEIKRLNGNG